MKRLLIIFLMAAVMLCGCSQPQTKETFKNKASSGVWFSFSEINTMLKSEKGFKAEVDLAVENCKKLKIENVYIHIRAFCDSLFVSDYFPLIDEAKDLGFDAFEYILEAFHNENIKVHAWINPYRVSTTSEDINELNPESPAYKWLKDDNEENDRNVCFANGIYLNPAESEARALVINGVREVIEKYQIDGVHFDDYFYPTTASEFDLISYEEYRGNTENPLPLDEWRRTNVNSLVSGCKSAIEFSQKDIEFSISPAASIEDNYNNLYADVGLWVENGYIDAVIPQLYFGFEYPIEEYRFENLLVSWKKLAACNDEVELLIGLANYKIGTDSEPDKAEWKSNNDIIARQVEICYKDDRVTGYIFFSFSSLFSNDEQNIKQREAVLKILNNSEENYG